MQILNSFFLLSRSFFAQAADSKVWIPNFCFLNGLLFQKYFKNSRIRGQIDIHGTYRIGVRAECRRLWRESLGCRIRQAITCLLATSRQVQL